MINIWYLSFHNLTKLCMKMMNKDRYSRITLVVPNYEAAPRLFYSEYFWQRYITCDSAAHQELPMGKIFPEILNLCESRKFCDDPASRWAILPPSDLLTLIDFSFWLPQIKSGRIH